MFWKFFKKEKRKPQLPNSVLMPLDKEAKEFHSVNADTEEPVSNFQPDESEKPDKIRLITDECHLEGLGKLKDGTYFLISSQLKRDHKANATVDYICKFCFNSDGNLIDHKIVRLGIRGKFEHEDGVKEYVKIAPAKGTYEGADISIKPFSVNFEGVELSLIHI